MGSGRSRRRRGSRPSSSGRRIAARPPTASSERTTRRWSSGSALPVGLVPGLPGNVKVTRPEDLPLARQLLRGRRAGSARARPGEAAPMTRVGLGFDVHPLVEGRPLVLGGVEVPAARASEGTPTRTC